MTLDTDDGKIEGKEDIFEIQERVSDVGWPEQSSWATAVSCVTKLAIPCMDVMVIPCMDVMAIPCMDVMACPHIFCYLSHVIYTICIM